jgi:hypothetical protein
MVVGTRVTEPEPDDGGADGVAVVRGVVAGVVLAATVPVCTPVVLAVVPGETAGAAPDEMTGSFPLEVAPGAEPATGPGTEPELTVAALPPPGLGVLEFGCVGTAVVVAGPIAAAACAAVVAG